MLEGRASLKHTEPQFCFEGEHVVRALCHSHLCQGATLLEDFGAEMLAARGNCCAQGSAASEGTMQQADCRVW